MATNEDDAPASSGFDLAERVIETILEAEGQTGQAAEIYYAMGQCGSLGDEGRISILLETRVGSISFVEDAQGASWLAWHIFVSATYGAHRIVPKDEAEPLTKFCLNILAGWHFQPFGQPRRH